MGSSKSKTFSGKGHSLAGASAASRSNDRGRGSGKGRGRGSGSAAAGRSTKKKSTATPSSANNTRAAFQGSGRALGSNDGQDAPPRSHREALCRLYLRVAPSKEKNVPALLEQYAGREEVLYGRLEEKYPGQVRRPQLASRDNAAARKAKMLKALDGRAKKKKNFLKVKKKPRDPSDVGPPPGRSSAPRVPAELAVSLAQVAANEQRRTTCPSCTFVNAPGGQACAVCEAPLPTASVASSRAPASSVGPDGFDPFKVQFSSGAAGIGAHS